tara:strand:- start:78 stop:686 length:609 start_codon:yes stop_codon:yes gene_type:complete
MVTKRDLEVAIAAYGLGRVIPAGATRAAIRKAIPALVRGGVAVAPPAAQTLGTLAAANPVSTGLGLGAATLASPAGTALLEAAAERGAADRIAVQQLIDEAIFRNVTLPQRQITEVATSDMFAGAVKAKAKRKVSKYQKAVKAGMAAVKKSKFGGKKGTIKNAKTTFATVNKVASAVNKGKKVATTGIRGVAAKAIKGILRR